MSDHTIVIIWVIKTFFCTVLLCSIATSSLSLLAILLNSAFRCLYLSFSPLQNERRMDEWSRAKANRILPRECTGHGALGNITMNKFNGGDGIPAEPFQILKDDAVKVLHSIYQQICKTQQWPQDWKGELLFQSQRKAMPKNVQTTAQLHSFHMLAR